MLMKTMVTINTDIMQIYTSYLVRCINNNLATGEQYYIIMIEFIT